MAARGATEIIVHGTAVALGNRAALLRGASGSGKSDLALRAIASPLNGLMKETFALVADDQVVVRRSGTALTVSPPVKLAGLIEVRGIGIVDVAHRGEARLELLVDLAEADSIERLPDPWPEESLLDVRIPVLKLAPFEMSAPLKLAVALQKRPWAPLG